MRPIAYLAPEIPSVSGTFVFREILAMEGETGRTVLPYSLHRVGEEAISADGRSFLPRVRVVYEAPLARLAGALRFTLRHPRAVLNAGAVVLRDLVRRPSRHGWKLFPQFLAGLWLAGELEERGAEHLHVHFAHSPGSVGMYASLVSGIPYSVTAHANDIYVHGRLLEEKIRRSRAFLTISEANRTYLRARLGPVAETIGLVRCGIDRARFASKLDRDGEPLVFTVGRLIPKKGFDVLLRALARTSPSIRCVIAGDGPQREELEELARTLGLEDRVRFLGAIDTERVRFWLRNARVFALPCRRTPEGDVDGIPVALMEAMSSGCPVISTRISGIPELVQDGVSGLLVEGGDEEALARALDRLLGDPVLARSLAEGGRRVVDAEFGLRRNARALFEAFQLEAVPAALPRGETPKRDQGPAQAQEGEVTPGTDRAASPA
jgi:glycosyltransferase involved in cell wall biosynthesis